MRAEQAMALPKTYQDKQGRVRLSLSSVTDSSLRTFFDEIVKNGLKRNVQVYGEAVRDIVSLGKTDRLAFFLSPVTEPKTVMDLLQKMQDVRKGMMLINMGHMEDYDFKVPDIALNKMTIVKK